MKLRYTTLLGLVSAALVVASAAFAGQQDDGPFAVAVKAAPVGDGAVSALTASNKGVQRTPDNQHILVSKDVGAERWAIALNADDTIIGNVFLCDGSAPAFVWCSLTADDHNSDYRNRIFVWQCYGADACTTQTCGAITQWPLINGHVQLTGSFFLP